MSDRRGVERVSPNQALERTADRRMKKVEMLIRRDVEMETCALVSGRSALSR
jgi:hypothetical protein